MDSIGASSQIQIHETRIMLMNTDVITAKRRRTTSHLVTKQMFEERGVQVPRNTTENNCINLGSFLPW